MELMEIYEELTPVLYGMARRFEVKGHPLLSAEDLYSLETVAMLELAQARPELHGKDLKLMIVTTCKNAITDAIRSAFRQRRSPEGGTLSYETVMLEGEKPLAYFLSDGSYERLREKIESDERRSLLTALERSVLTEIESPSEATLQAFQEEVYCLREKQLNGDGVRVHERLQARHIARGLRINVKDVQRALEGIRQVLLEAA